VVPTNKVSIQKEEESKPPLKKNEEPRRNQQNERDMRPSQDFTSLHESLHDVLKKILDHNIITLPEIRPDEMQNKNGKWYRENEFCNYHRQRGHDTNKCHSLKHVVQDLIDEGKLQVETPSQNPNQDLGIYQNPLPHHANNISSSINQVTHKINPNYTGYVSMISVATRAQKSQNKQTTTTNQQSEIPNIPRPQYPKVSVKGALQQQLKSSQVKLSLFDLLQQSKDH